MPLFNFGDYIPTSAMNNNVPMDNDTTKVPTEAAAFNADIAVYNAALAQDGKIFPSTGVTTGSFAVPRKATTNSSGVATIYLTDDNTATGNAVFSTVYEDGIVVLPVGADNYSITGVVLVGTKKYITVTVGKISTVLGLLTFNANAGAGVEVRAIVLGK